MPTRKNAVLPDSGGISTTTQLIRMRSVSITAELKEGDEDVISILVGGRAEDHLGHIIHAPSHVRLKQTEEGAHEVLHIESKNGATTLVRFRSTMLPELVDGIVLDR